MAEKEKIIEYQLVNVPTQYTTAVQTPEGETMSVEQAIVLLLNKIDKIDKAVA